MNGMRKFMLGRTLLLVLLAMPVEAAMALVITDSTLTISNISITPSFGIASIDPWTAEASAATNNSLGQSDGQFNSSSALAVANAAVTFAAAHGQTNALNVTANAASAVNLPGFFNQAAATGLGSLFTFFAITGGTGNVDVTFSMHLDGLQHGFADSVGSFHNELVASLELDGAVVLFRDSILSGGPSFPDTTDTFATALSDTRTLIFGTQYFVFVQADSESNAINLPEPTGLALVLAGFGLLAWRRFRRVVA